MTMAQLDQTLVLTLGLKQAAKEFTQGARDAGIAVPSRFGMEVVARLLGLRTNHPAAQDFLELRPQDPATRAELFGYRGVILGSAEASAFMRFVPFLGFYLCGYVLRDKILSRNSLIACWLLAISCVFLLAGGTGLLRSTFGPKLYPSPSYMLYDFVSPVRIALGVSVWLIFVNQSSTDLRASRRF